MRHAACTPPGVRLEGSPFLVPDQACRSGSTCTSTRRSWAAGVEASLGYVEGALREGRPLSGPVYAAACRCPRMPLHAVLPLAAGT